MQLQTLHAILGMQASAVSCSEAPRQHVPNSGALKSILTESYLLQFASDSSQGVLACVSMDVKLHGATARQLCQVRTWHIHKLSVVFYQLCLPYFCTRHPHLFTSL